MRPPSLPSPPDQRSFPPPSELRGRGGRKRVVYDCCDRGLDPCCGSGTSATWPSLQRLPSNVPHSGVGRAFEPCREGSIRTQLHTVTYSLFLSQLGHVAAHKANPEANSHPALPSPGTRSPIACTRRIAQHSAAIYLPTPRPDELDPRGSDPCDPASPDYRPPDPSPTLLHPYSPTDRSQQSSCSGRQPTTGREQQSSSSNRRGGAPFPSISTRANPPRPSRAHSLGAHDQQALDVTRERQDRKEGAEPRKIQAKEDQAIGSACTNSNAHLVSQQGRPIATLRSKHLIQGRPVTKPAAGRAGRTRAPPHLPRRQWHARPRTRCLPRGARPPHPSTR